MKQSVASIILVASLFTACTSSKIANYHFNQKTAAPQLQQDVMLLKQILEANHPSLYWYTPKDSLDAAFNNAFNSITDSLTEIEFRNRIAAVISKIRCGHTAVKFSKNYASAVEAHRYPSFPLSIKTWGDSMVVLGSLFPRDGTFKRGTIITSINNRSSKQLIDSMSQLLSTDGYSDNFKSQVFSINFPNWYKLAFGIDSTYSIGYIDAFGNAKTKVVTNFSPVKDTTKHTKTIGGKPVTPPPSIVKKSSKHQQKQIQLLAKRSFTIDTANSTALLRVATFSGSLKPFFKQSLKKIAHQHIKNVVVDVRENTGGKLENSTALTRYFSNKSFKTGDTIAAITRNIHYKRYIAQSYFLWLPLQIFSKKRADGRYHKLRDEIHIYKPQKQFHFNGDIYLLQGGLSFSAATLFVSNLKGQRNVTVVGEETGGGFYGNTAMFLPTVILPNSKLRIILPLYRLVIDSSREKNGHGILPDILLPPNSIAIKKGIDLKMDTIKSIILKKTTVSSIPN